MRTINAEYKPFGLCSEDVRKELSKYEGTKELKFWDGDTPNSDDGWVSCALVCQSHLTYRVQIPDEPKKIPLSQEEWLKVSMVHFNYQWRSVDTISETMILLSNCRDAATLEDMIPLEAVDALGNPIKLYKYEDQNND